MSRRSIILLATGVVLLYFSIILFMLSPLHGSKNMYYGNNYMNHLSLKAVPNVNWCKELQFKRPMSNNVVALVSYPGSGNTWLRYLLQQATGILTGSIYMDYGLRLHGFPAENVTDGSVLVVKTHEAPPREASKFSAAVLLIRNPRDAILADFNRVHKGHIGTAPKSAFIRKSLSNKDGETDWALYVARQLSYWESFHWAWLGQFAARRAVHVVFYEGLVRDTGHCLEGVLQFLNYTATEEDIKCALLNKEGIYRRKKKHKNFDPYTEEMDREIEQVKNRVLNMVARYQMRHRNKRVDRVRVPKS